MKKLISVLMTVALACGCLLGLAACGGKGSENFVAVDAGDLKKEDYGIAVQKGSTKLLPTINEVIGEFTSEGKLNQYIDYYTALDEYSKGSEPQAPTAPDGLTVSWDFSNKTAGTITMVTEAGFAPFEFNYGDSDIVGVDVAIMSEVAVRLNMKLEIKNVAFDFIITEMNKIGENAVGAAGMTITETRKEEVDFSDIYYSTTLVIVSLKDKAYSKVADLAGLKVGVQEGTTGDIVLTEAQKESGYTYEDEDGNEVTVKTNVKEIKRLKEYALVYQDLKNGKIDAILMDKLPALSLLANA